MLPNISHIVPSPVKSLIRSILPDSAKRRLLKIFRDGLTYESPKHLSAEQWASWDKNGYLVLPKMFDTQLVSNINSLVDQFWSERKKDTNPLVIDIYIGTAEEKRIFFKDAPDDAKKYPYKLNDLFLESELVRNVITSPLLCGVLADLLEGDPLICNSLTFERSSQQRFHFDTFYMPPPVKNRMVASWIALEDAHNDAGPLEYFPGSHKIPPYRFSDGRLNQISAEMPAFDRYMDREIRERGLKPEIFPATAGDVLIWHAQLYHGGRVINDMSRTRRSLVTHYFRAIDFAADQATTIAPGRHYMNRGHQKVM